MSFPPTIRCIISVNYFMAKLNLNTNRKPSTEIVALISIALIVIVNGAVA